MLTIGSSSMKLFQFQFYLLLFICCLIPIRSYKIDHRPFEDRHERAVTEWRFRRNFLLSLPYIYPNYITDEHLINNEANENENYNGIDTYEKKFIPNLLYDHMNK